jgi:hypothetical protein
MEALLAMVGGKLGLLALGAGSAATAFFGPGLVRRLVSREVGKLLANALDPKTDDPKRKDLQRNLIVAAAKLAAYELPNRGHGPERKNAIKDRLMKLLPEKQSEVIASLLDEAIDTLDDQLEAVKDVPAPAPDAQ